MPCEAEDITILKRLEKRSPPNTFVLRECSFHCVLRPFTTPRKQGTKAEYIKFHSPVPPQMLMRSDVANSEAAEGHGEKQEGMVR